MATVLDVISDALTQAGQLGQGQTANPEDGALGLRQLNLILSKASTRRLMLPYVAQRQYNLIANTADYTLGPTGSIVATRPTLIESAQINVPGSSVWIPVNILDKTKFDAIVNRAAVDEIITSVYVEYQSPNLAFHVHPKPSGTPAIRFGAWEILTQFVTLFDVLAMPDPYEEWLTATLSVVIAPYYDQPVTQGMLTRAADAAQAVQEHNAQSIGGALSAEGKYESPNVGQPIPQGQAQ